MSLPILGIKPLCTVRIQHLNLTIFHFGFQVHCVSNGEECSDVQKKHVEEHTQCLGVGGLKNYKLIGYSTEGDETKKVFCFSDTGYKKVRL